MTRSCPVQLSVPLCWRSSARVRLTKATGTAKREAALEMIDELWGNYPVTVDADKAYDTRDLVAGLRRHAAVPHVAQNTTNRRSVIDRRTTRYAGYRTSQRCLKKVEELFGWLKTVGWVGWMFTFATALQPGQNAEPGEHGVAARTGGCGLAFRLGQKAQGEDAGPKHSIVRSSDTLAQYPRERQSP